jgi:sugar phosphate isomerase/epimerase
MTRRRSPSKIRNPRRPTVGHETRADRPSGTPYTLCLSASHAPDADIDRELQTASQAGFSCVELWAPALDAYLARHPLVWLELQLRQHGLYVSAISDLDPLPAADSAAAEDRLVHQAHFLELCAHLDALGGGTLVLHLDASQETRGTEASTRALRDYADLAAPFEVTLALEFRATSRVPDFEAALDLVRRAARSNVRLAISAREWCASGAGPRSLEAFEPGLLALVHLDDTLDPSPQSEAPDPARDLYARLAAAGFRGPYCVPLPAPHVKTSATPAAPGAQGAQEARARAARQAAQDLLAPLFEPPPTV